MSTTNPEPDLSDDFDEYRERTSSAAQFEGDDGRLDPAQRKALVVLLKNRFITTTSHPREYATIADDPRSIRRHLHDLFLDLELDAAHEVAYKRQAAPEAGSASFPTLLHDTAWGREETVLLVYLRTRFRNQQAAGEVRVYVDREDLLEHIDQRRPSTATDRHDDKRKSTRAIENVARAGLLIGRIDADRYEISSAIEVMLPVAKLTELLTWLRAQNEPRAPSDAPTKPIGPREKTQP